MEPKALHHGHLVAVPYPGLGHVNPMMNLCSHIASSRPDVLITVVVTEEWLGFIGSEPRPSSIRLRSIPNVIPSELDRAADFPGFVEAVYTKMEAPFEELMNRGTGLEEVSCIVADTYLPWVVDVGRRRNIPVASLWTMSPSVLSLLRHFELLRSHHHFPLDHVSGREAEKIDYIPGIPSIRLADLYPIIRLGNVYSNLDKKPPSVLERALGAVFTARKAQFFLFTCSYVLDAPAFDALSSAIPFPVLPVGPCIPYMKLQEPPLNSHHDDNVNYVSWLDKQAKSSVLYVSLGSLWRASWAQMEELAKGLQESGVHFLWVARSDSPRLQDLAGERGLVVPWCDQLRVLCHSSVGGFLSHCGWNSTMEAAFAGKPMLTFPISWDQFPNSKMIVEDWGVGLRLRREVSDECVVSSDEVASGVRRLMDVEGDEGKEMRKKSMQLKEACTRALEKGRSCHSSLLDFISHVEQGCK